MAVINKEHLIKKIRENPCLGEVTAGLFAKFVEDEPELNGWIPADDPPEDDSYVLISFENYSVPVVGRYEEDEEGGAYYAGDEDISLVSQGMIVNAWQQLPKCYCEEN